MNASVTVDGSKVYICTGEVNLDNAANGTVRDGLDVYAAGRNDPVGPMGEKEYYMSMDRYCGFAYSELIEQLILSPKLKGL